MYCSNVLVSTIAAVYIDKFEKLFSALNRLMVEGDLLEVSLPEKLQLRHVLRICHPADYEQIIFGFPVSTSVYSMQCSNICLQCFDAVGWAAGRAPPLHSTPLTGRAIKPQRQGHIGGPIAQP